MKKRERQYFFEGHYWDAEDLVAKFSQNGVTVPTFKRRMQRKGWDVMTALTKPPLKKPAYSSSEAEHRPVQVIFPRHIYGIFSYMQPLLNVVYEGVCVKLPKLLEERSEFVVVTLDNGKKLLAYKGEYLEVG